MLRRLSVLGTICLLLFLLYVPAFAGDEPFATLKAPLCENGAPYSFGVYKVGLNENVETLCRVDIRRPDATLAEPLYYTLRDPDSVMAGHFLRLIDINADGCLDLEAFSAGGASNRFCAYFVFDGKTNFLAPKEIQNLSNLRVYPKQKLMYADEQEGVLTGRITLFSWRPDGLTPYVFRTAVTDWDEQTPDAINALVVEYHEEDGTETVLMDETLLQPGDEQALQAFEARRDEALWQGLDAAEAYIE